MATRTGTIRATVTDALGSVRFADLPVAIPEDEPPPPEEGQGDFIMFGALVSPANTVAGLQMIEGVITLGTGPGVGGQSANFSNGAGDNCRIAYYAPENRYLATGYRDPSLTRGRLAYSDDFGLTWSDPNPTTIDSGPTCGILCRPSDGRLIVSNTAGRFNQSDDGGLTWSAASTTSSVLTKRGYIRADNNEFIFGQRARLLRFGNSRTELASGTITIEAFPGTTLNYAPWETVQSTDQQNLIVSWQDATGQVEGQSTIAFSTDHGATWTASADQVPVEHMPTALHYANGLFVCTYRNARFDPYMPQLARSTDGNNWTFSSLADLFEGLYTARLTDIAFHNGQWCFVGWQQETSSSTTRVGIIVTSSNLADFTVTEVPDMRIIAGVMARQTA
jgi:hypothetical protein